MTSAKSCSKVWDPGAKEEVKISANKVIVPTWMYFKQRLSDTPTKEVVNSVNNLSQHSSYLTKRASPNKSQDSGFSDSGESEVSTSIHHTNEDCKPHVTRIYLYSNTCQDVNSGDQYREECHYKSPSSLPLNRNLHPSLSNSFKAYQSVSSKEVNIIDRVEKSRQWLANSNPEVASNNSEESLISSRSQIHSSTQTSDLAKKGIKKSKIKIDNKKCLSAFFPSQQRNPAVNVKSSIDFICNTQPDANYQEQVDNTDKNDNCRINSVNELLKEFRKESPESCYDDIGASRSVTTSSRSAPSSPSISGFSENSFCSNGKSTDGSLRESCQQLIRSPVDHWLSELPSLYESECSVMLQSKSLHGGPLEPQQQKFSIQEDVRKIQEQAKIVSKNFAELCRHLSRQSTGDKLIVCIKTLESEVKELLSSKSNNSVTSLSVSLANEDVRHLPGLKTRQGIPGESREDPPFPDSCQGHNMVKEQQKLLNLLHNLKLSVTRVHRNHMTEIVETVTEFGSCLTSLVEMLLSNRVEMLVNYLSDEKSSSEIELALSNLTNLGLEGNHLCRLVARHGGVRLMVKLLTNNKFSSIKGAILRALGTVCCVLEAIRQLEEVQGVEVISRVLAERGARETEQAEAAGVIAQVTSPWIEENNYILGVAENAFNLVKSLTEICRNTKCPETFLLSSAALANLSFLSPLVLTAMSKMDTVSVLLSFLSHNVQPSIYIQDQVATVLANMAARQDTRDLLLNCNLVHVLLYLLAASTPSSQELAIMAATQRVQQKAAIAIGRLSCETSVVSGILAGSGLERLVELSVCKKARLDSDSTLVAVITAVRKISLTQEIQIQLEKLGAKELLLPNLVNSFKLFSTKHESFV